MRLMKVVVLDRLAHHTRRWRDGNFDFHSRQGAKFEREILCTVDIRWAIVINRLGKRGIIIIIYI